MYFKSIFFFALTSMFLFGSCGEDENNTPASLTGTFEVDIDGSRFLADFSSATYNSISLDSSQNTLTLLSLSGIKNIDEPTQEAVIILYYLLDISTLQARAYDYTGECVFSNNNTTCSVLATIDGDIDAMDFEGASFNTNASQDSRQAINLTSVDIRNGGRISGTFSGTIYNDDGEVQVLTNGRFDLPVTEQ